MDTKSWIFLAIGIALVLGLAIAFVVIAVKKKLFGQIFETLKIAIKEAEKNFPGEGRGKEKEEYVLAEIQKKCEELDIRLGFILKMILKAIKEIIAGYNVISK